MNLSFFKIVNSLRFISYYYFMYSKKWVTHSLPFQSMMHSGPSLEFLCPPCVSSYLTLVKGGITWPVKIKQGCHPIITPRESLYYCTHIFFHLVIFITGFIHTYFITGYIVPSSLRSNPIFIPHDYIDLCTLSVLEFHPYFPHTRPYTLTNTFLLHSFIK